MRVKFDPPIPLSKLALSPQIDHMIEELNTPSPLLGKLVKETHGYSWASVGGRPVEMVTWATPEGEEGYIEGMRMPPAPIHSHNWVANPQGPGMVCANACGSWRAMGYTGW